MWHNDLIINTY